MHRMIPRNQIQTEFRWIVLLTQCDIIGILRLHKAIRKVVFVMQVNRFYLGLVGAFVAACGAYYGWENHDAISELEEIPLPLALFVGVFFSAGFCFLVIKLKESNHPFHQHIISFYLLISISFGFSGLFSLFKIGLAEDGSIYGSVCFLVMSVSCVPGFVIYIYQRSKKLTWEGG